MFHKVFPPAATLRRQPLHVALVAFLATALSLSTTHAQLDLQWARGNTGSPGQTSEESAVAVDAFGNVYSVGNFNSPAIDFDPDPIDVFNLSHQGGLDIYIRKLDPQGNLVWVYSIGGTNDDYATDIAVDNLGNVVLTGQFVDNVDFKPDGGTYFMNGSVGDAFVASFTTSGMFNWATQMGSPASANDKGTAITTDGAGNVITVGVFGENGALVDFDPSAGYVYLTCEGAGDGFVQKLTKNGVFVWAYAISSDSDFEVAKDVETDAAGNIYTVGTFAGPNNCDFDPSAGTYYLIGQSRDGFVQKVDPNANFLWAHQIGSTSSDGASSLAVDAVGGCYISGNFAGGNVDFDPGPGNFPLNSASGSRYVLKLDQNGDFVWAGQSAADINSLDVDGTQGIYVAGSFSGTVDFDPGAGTELRTSAGLDDIFITKVAVGGNHIGTRTMGGPNNDKALQMVVDNAGYVYVVGSFADPFDFNALSHPPVSLDPGAINLPESFAAKYAQCVGNFMAYRPYPPASPDTLVPGDTIGFCVGESITFTGDLWYNTISQAANYVWTLDGMQIATDSLISIVHGGNSGMHILQVVPCGSSFNCSACYETTTFYLNFRQPIPLNMTAPVEVCNGGSFYLDSGCGSGGCNPDPVSYIWDCNSGSTCGVIYSNTPAQYVTPGGLGNYIYYVTATDALNCSASASVSVNVIPCNPTITAAPSKPYYCYGENITLSGDINNANIANPTYIWYIDGYPYDTAAVTTYSVPGPAVYDTLSIRLDIYQGAALIATSTASLVILDPSISLVPSSSYYCLGGNVPSLYLDYGNSCPGCIAGLYDANGTQLFIVNGLPQSAGNYPTGTYYAQMEGCADISNIVTISDLIVTASVTATPATFCNGDYSTLQVSSNISGNPVYTWSHLGWAADISTQTVNTAGTYYVAATDTAANCADTVDVYVSSVACTNSLTLSPNKTFYCSGETVTMSGEALGIADPVYVWFVNGSPYDTTQTIFYDLPNGFSGLITVQLDIYSGLTYITSMLESIDVYDADITLSPSSAVYCPALPPVNIALSNNNPCAGCLVNIYNANGLIVAPSPITGLPNNAVGLTAGSYYAKMQGCTQISNLVTIEDASVTATLTPVPNDTFCTGNTVTLSAASNILSPTYTLNGSPMSGGLQTVNAEGFYQFIATDASTTCADTIVLFVEEIENRLGNFAPVTSMQTTDSPQDLLAALFFSPAPPPIAGTFSGSGVSGDYFYPSVAGAGTHTVTYSYTEAGCTYTVSANIIVGSNTPTVSFVNQDPTSSPYHNSEACINDTLYFTLNNFSIQVDRVYFSNGLGGFTAPVAVLSPSYVPAGPNWNGTFLVVVPSDARTGTLRLEESLSSNYQDVGALIVNRPTVNLIGLPNTICSSSDYTLTGVPAGGTFTAYYQNNSTAAAIFTGNVLDAGLINGYNSGARDIVVEYTYTPRYGGGAGASCGSSIIVDDTTNARTVAVDTITFFPISTSENAVLIDSIINAITPDTVQNYTTNTFAGSFITGSTDFYFNATAAGVGNHTITYQVNNGACIGNQTGVITVIDAPTMQGLVGQYCYNADVDTMTRDMDFIYAASNTPGQTTYIYTNTMVVSATNYPPTMPAQGGPTPNDQYYLFDPTAVTTSPSTVTVLYRTIIETHSTTPPYALISSRSYIVGRVVSNIVIGTGATVSIVDRDPHYCETNTYELIRVTPVGGVFYVEQLDGLGVGATFSQNPNASGEAFINPYLLHLGESTDVNYRIRYVYGAAGCTSSDSLDIVIPEPANATFATLSGNSTYCRSDAADSLVATVAGGTFSIDGFITANNRFNPAVQSIGQHIIRYTIANSYNCLSQTADTVLVNALPVLAWDTSIDPRYCQDAAPFSLGATPVPNPPTTSGTLTVESNQGILTMTNPFSFDPAALLAGSTTADTVALVYTYTDANTCSNTLTRQVIINPLPTIFIADLAPVYCQGSPAIGLNPFPVTGTLTMTPTTTNLNTATAVYNPAALTGTQYLNYTYTDPATTCTSVHLDTTSVINVAVTVGIVQGLPDDACFTGDTLVLIATPQPAPGAAFFTSSANTANGGIVYQNLDTVLFVPNQAQTGDVVVAYTYTSGGCAKVAQDTIDIRPLPDLRMVIGANIDSICQSYAPINITVYDDNFFPPQLLTPNPNFSVAGNGVYLDGSVYKFHPDSVQAGWNIITASYIDPYGCSVEIRDSVKALANPYPYLSGLQPEYCNTSAPDTVIGLPQGGIWQPLGVTSPLYVPAGASYAVFDPSSAFAMGITTINYHVTYVNGCQNETDFDVLVSPPPVLQILSPANNQQFCENDALVDVITAVDGIPTRAGIVTDNSQPGGIVADTLFNPGAGTGTRFVTFEYTDPSSGCYDLTLISVFVVAAPDAEIDGLDEVYCIDNDPATLLNATSASITSATYSNSSGVGIAPIVGTFDATYDPSAVGIGLDTVYLVVVNSAGCSDTAAHEVSIRDLPSGLFMSLTDTIICENEGLIPVSGFPSGVGGRFFLVNNTTSNVVDSNDVNINLRPSNYGTGSYSLIFSYEDQAACSNQISQLLEIHPTPQADYIQQGFCEGDTVRLIDQSYFASTLNALDTITGWQWTYGGFSLASTTVPYAAFYDEEAGWNHATLVVTSQAGCRDTITSAAVIDGSIGDTVFIYNIPFANFQAVGGCQNDPILFNADSTDLESIVQGIAFDRITRIVWNFGDGDSTVVLPTGTAINPTSHTYTQPGIYYPSVRVFNNDVCQVSDTVRLVVSPSVNPYPTPYLQDFEASQGDWYASMPDGQNLWEWGEAAGGTIYTIDNNVWKTDLDAPYPDGQATWVFGPCFNFTNSVRPMIKFDYFADMYDFDGVVLEYYDKSQDKWLTVGEKNRGINWYNNPNSIFGLLNFKQLSAGVQLDGFTGETEGWMSGRYRLDDLKGKNFVRFRFAFGSLEGVINDEENEGFAFDNVWVGERSRNVLVEYFSNIYAFNIAYSNQYIYNMLFNNTNGSDIAFIEYHNNGGNDPINSLNSDDHNARFQFYGAGAADVVLDGNGYQGKSYTVTQQMLDMQMLEDPMFAIPHDSIKLTIQVTQSGEATVRLKGLVQALKAMPQAEYTVSAVVVEDSVFMLQGTFLHSVMRKFLPEHGALSYEMPWTLGQKVHVDESWNEPDFTDFYIKQRMHGMIFIQNETTKEVYQVGSTRDLDFYLTGVVPVADNGEPILPNLKLYPNPAVDYFTVAFDNPLEENYQWQLMDMRGVVVQTGNFAAGTVQSGISSYDLPAGVYVLGMANEDESIYLQRKVVIVRP